MGLLTNEELGGVDALFDTWSKLGQICFSNESGAEKPSDELFECATSAMRALTQKLVEVKSPQLGLVSKGDLERILTSPCSDPRSKVNVIHIAGAIGSLVAAKESKESDEVVGGIGLYLCELAAKETNLRVVAEALDKIFDIFGEDNTDPTCQRIELVAKLQSLLPGLKTKMAIQRRTMSGQDHSIIVMAKTNLVRFINYKKKQRS